MNILFLLLATLVGVGGTLQGVVNGSLGSKVGIWEGTLVNMCVGFVILVIASALAGTGNIKGVLNAPLWAVLGGGIIGTFMVLFALVCIPKLGAVLTSTVTMLTALVCNIFVDTFGLFGLEAKAISTYRIIGVLILLAGILITYVEPSKKIEAAQTEKNNIVKFLPLAVLNGVFQAVFAPINVVLNTHIGGIFETSAIVFAVSIILLIIIVAVTRKGNLKNLKSCKWYDYLGGLFGSAGVALAVLTIPVLGTVINSVCNQFGQLFMGITVDSTGLLGVPKAKISAKRIIGFAVIFASIIVLNFGI